MIKTASYSFTTDLKWVKKKLFAVKGDRQVRKNYDLTLSDALLIVDSLLTYLLT